MFNLPLLVHLILDTSDFYSRTTCTVDFHFYQGGILTPYLCLLIKVWPLDTFHSTAYNNRNELNDYRITALCSDKLQYYEIYIFLKQICVKDIIKNIAGSSLPGALLCSVHAGTLLSSCFCACTVVSHDECNQSHLYVLRAAFKQNATQRHIISNRNNW